VKELSEADILLLPDQRRRVINNLGVLGAKALEVGGGEAPRALFNVVDLVVDASQVNSDTTREEFQDIFGIAVDERLLEKFPFLTASFEEKRQQYLSGQALKVLEGIYTNRKNELQYMSQAKAEIVISHLITEYAERHQEFARNNESGKIHVQRTLLLVKGMTSSDIAKATGRAANSISTVYGRFINKVGEMPNQAKNTILDNLRSFGTELNVRGYVPASMDKDYHDNVADELDNLLAQPQRYDRHTGETWSYQDEYGQGKRPKAKYYNYDEDFVIG
jgi:hypothetical protein